jgi:uracil-DNA glycosylase
MPKLERIDTRQEAFLHLVERVQKCRLCQRMDGRARVLGRTNGQVPCRVLFVAEAPGRLGADRTGRPLFGDRSGNDFERLLLAAGLERNEVFVTNAVLCNPRDENDRNARPLQREVRNCSHFLQETIELVDPTYVVALGTVALRALRAVASHGIVLSRDVGVPVRWHGRMLIPLYHPGARAQIRRPLTLQLDDYARLGNLIRDGSGLV